LGWLAFVGSFRPDSDRLAAALRPSTLSSMGSFSPRRPPLCTTMNPSAPSESTARPATTLPRRRLGRIDSMSLSKSVSDRSLTTGAMLGASIPAGT
jgi:hypothetical protein